MTEVFLKTSNFSNSSSAGSSANMYPESDRLLRPPLTSLTQNHSFMDKSEHHSFFHDDFSFSRVSKLSRWQSEVDNSNQQTTSSGKYRTNNPFVNKQIPPPAFVDVLMSPMSRLSTSSSTLSFNNPGNYKAFEQPLSRSTITNSSDQLIVSNENMNIFPSTSFSRRQTVSAFDSMPTSLTDNDLQQVPPSFMIMPSSSTHATAPTLHSHSQPHPQVVHTANRSTSMPTWRGALPAKLEPITLDQHHTTAPFSQKVFFGGIPPELTEAELLLVLRQFGKCNIKWPKNDAINHNKPGFCHVVFRESRSVSELLKHCTRQQQPSTIDYFLHIHMSSTSTSTVVGAPIRPSRLKPIQVVPWNVKDNVHVMHHETFFNNTNNDTSNKDWSRTIFVSPLHGKMTAFSLATVMCDVFGPVSMAQINTDKYGYPTGTGTVLFVDSHSYMRAVAAGAIDIKCDCFHKLLDVDPFLRENEPCAFCSSVADLFCRNFHCLRSYCRQCWVNKHGPRPLADHQPVTRRQQVLQ